MKRYRPCPGRCWLYRNMPAFCLDFRMVTRMTHRQMDSRFREDNKKEAFICAIRWRSLHSCSKSLVAATPRYAIYGYEMLGRTMIGKVNRLG